MSKRTRSPMRECLRLLASAQRSERTAKTYAAIATAFLAFVGDRVPRRNDVERFLAKPLRSGSRASTATRNQALAAIRALARSATRTGAWEEDPTRELTFEREPEKDPAVLYLSEVQDFFRAVAEVSAPRYRTRDRAMLALLFTLGLRVTELTRLNVSQVDLTNAVLVAVRRKGGRIQDLPIAPGAAIVLQDWMSEHGALASPTESALFVSRSGLRLSARAVQRLFARLRERTGTHKHATPHTARHSFITLALTRGADVTVVSRVAGHASVTTTMRYRHLLDAEPRAAVGLVGAAILAGPHPANESASKPKQIPMSASTSEAWTNNASAANDPLDVHGHLDDAI